MLFGYLSGKKLLNNDFESHTIRTRYWTLFSEPRLSNHLYLNANINNSKYLTKLTRLT